MHICLISVLLYTITTVNGSNTKYIDLLPEKEKQDFLEKIARRILKEVETKDDRSRASREIPDEQLNEHDAFVQRIMKEETENLKRQSNGTEDHNTEDSSDRNNNIARIFPEEEKNNEQHIDLTFRLDSSRNKRESLRQVFTGFSPDNDNSTNVSKESDVDIQVKNFRRTKIPDKTNIFENTEVASNIENIANDTTRQENKTTILDQNGKTETITQNNDNQLETETTIQDDLNNTSTDNEKLNEEIENETTTDNRQETEGTETTEQDSFHDLPTEDTASEPIQLEEILKTYQNINYNDSEKIKEKDTNAVSDEFTKIPETTKRILRSSSVLDIDPYETKTKKLKDSQVINIEITPARTTEEVTLTTNKKNTNITETTITTEESKLLTPSSETTDNSNNETDTRNVILISKTEEVKNKPEKRLNKSRNKPKNLQNKLNSTLKSTESKLFTNAVIKALKLKLLENSNKSDKNLNYKTSHYSKTKPNNVHEVFEISPDESPFVKLKARNEPTYIQPGNKQPTFLQPDREQPKLKQHVVAEAPYHVPIYNYFPNNAFYNPHNVLGPNPDRDDDEDNEGIWIQNKEGYKFPSFMPKSATKLEQEEILATVEQPYHVPVYYYSPKNAYYNPNNYYGPNLQDSNEKLDENDKENNNDNYYIDKTDINKGNDQIEWKDYYDSLKSVKKSPINKIKPEAYKLNLPKSVVDYITKNTNIDLKAYVEANYSKKRKHKRRCNCKKCHYGKCSSGQSEENDSGNDVNENEDGRFTPMLDNVSKIRHFMFEAKHFVMLQPTNMSKYDSYLEVKEPNPTQGILRSSLPIYFEDIFNRDIHYNNDDKELVAKLRTTYENNNDYSSAEKAPKKSKHKNYNIAEIKLPKNSKNDAIKLIYYKNPTKKHYTRTNDKNDPFKKQLNFKTPKKEPHDNDKLQESIQTINKAHKDANSNKSPENIKSILKYLTRDKQREYDMIQELSNYMGDEEIMSLYLIMEKIEKMEKEKQTNALRTDLIKKELNAYEEVLGDMVKEDNRGLKNYDWLGTAVDLQSAMTKMADMVDSAQRNGDLHPSDWELLKYIVYLHQHAQDEIDGIFSEKGLRGMVLPRGKRGKHLIKNLMKESVLGVPGSRDGLQPRNEAEDELEEFGRFLQELQNGLYDLHTAIKYIAMVTTYKNQHWFENLKQIHVTTKRKPLLELLLHLSTTRLLGLIEESASKGLEDSFLDYLKKNEKEVERTREEFVFVLKLLDEIKRAK